MPLRDHFRHPTSKFARWDALHGALPALIVIDLNKRLPPRYVASPNIHLGAAFEINIAARERHEFSTFETSSADEGGGVATAVWAPPKPTLAVATDLPEQDEYEVQIFDEEEDQRLVAAIEIVSPANKDRPEQRVAFAGKCAALLRRGVSVSIVDVVTVRHSNLYGELLDLIGHTDPTLSPAPPVLYAAACRWREAGRTSWRLETWVHPMEVGRSLPTLPLWLADDLAVPLELESSYEETCRVLRIQ
jgi:hypothetical protein